MGNKILYITLFLIFNSSFGQNAIEITYGKELIILPEYQNNIKYTKKIISFQKSIASLRYMLIIDKNKSYFEFTEKMASDLNKTSIRSIQSGGIEKKFYTDINNKTKQYASELFDEKFLVSQPYNKYNWDLKRDEKNILGFKCFRAITTLEINDFRGKLSVPIEVWYAPKLPSGFGPSSYSGVPGTVLEVIYDQKIKIFATNITTTEKTIPTKKIKGRNISERELIEIFNEGMNKIKNEG